MPILNQPGTRIKVLGEPKGVSYQVKIVRFSTLIFESAFFVIVLRSLYFDAKFDLAKISSLELLLLLLCANVVI